MTQVDRNARLRQRLAESKHASNADHVMNVVRGKEAVRVGMPVEVERASGERKAPNGDSYHVKIKASTESVARDMGIIPMKAWSNGGLRNFTDNPIILAYHDHKQPIGRSVYTEINGNSLVEYWEFHEESEVSRMMKTLYEKGFMRAASVGFLVHEYTFVDELDDKELEKLVAKYGASAVRDIYWIAERAELLETSAVPVPSDPNALAFSFAARNAEAVGMDIAPIREFLTNKDTEMTEAEKEAQRKAAEAAAAAATDQGAEITALRGEIAELKASIEELRGLIEKSAAAPAAAVVTPAADTSASTESDTSNSDTREAGVSIGIEKLDGETDEEAVARTVAEMVAKLRGAPIPSVK